MGRLVMLPFLLVATTLAAVARGGRAVFRVIGFRGVLALVAGVGLGALFAPVPGRELRDQLRRLAARRGASSDAELAERVVFELEHAPRTWHLPQPVVSVVEGRVALSGQVDADASRHELGRVAAAVPGVVAVENLIAVADAGTLAAGPDSA